MQVPDATIVTVVPDTVQTLDVEDETVTVNPESDDGEIVIGVADQV